MADITNGKNFSSILIKRKQHMVFGTLDDVSDEEKIRIALSEFKKYHEIINDMNQRIVLSWREAKENDWCFSDDLRIVQVLVRNNNSPRTDTTSSFNKGYIRTCVGVFPINPNTFMDTRFELHPNRYSIGQSKKNFNERLKERERLTAKEEMFCTYVANGMDVAKAYLKSYETENIVYANMSGTRLLQQERIQSAISDEVEEILTNEGVSKSYIIKQYKKLVDDGLMDLKNCSSSVRAALRDLSEISNMFPEKNKTIQSVQGALTSVPQDRLEAIRNKRFELTGKVDEPKPRPDIQRKLQEITVRGNEIQQYDNEDESNELLI